MHFQEPHGKTLKISFIGSPPYVTYHPLGGSAFIVAELLAKKFQFNPIYNQAQSWDIIEKHNTTFGMVRALGESLENKITWKYVST